MKNPIRLERDGDLAFLVIDNPPTNLLDPHVRQNMSNSLKLVLADPKVRVIIIAAAGRNFSHGIALRELDTDPMDDPVSLGALCSQIEMARKPVVIALHGEVFGGGLELALAAHYRVAAPGTRFAMPGVALGIIPNAGATQRLPRLVGPDAALEMLLSGASINTQQATAIGLLDRVDELAAVHDIHAGDDSRAAARDFASDQLAPRPTSRRDGYLQDVDAFIAIIAGHQVRVDDYYHRSIAAETIVRCVEAAILLPFSGGLELERDASTERALSAEAQALRYIHFAHEAAGQIAHVDQLQLPSFDRLGIYGTGRAGIALAGDTLAKGHWVSLAAHGASGMKKALAGLGEHFKSRIVAGTMTDRQAAKALGLLQLTGSANELSDCDLVMEALDPGDKVRGLRQLHAVLGKDIVLASDMRAGDFAELERASGRAETFVGLRSRLSVEGSTLVEIVVGNETSAETIAATHGFLQGIGKTPICTRFVVSQRMEGAMRIAANRLVLMGATPGQIDASMRLFGLASGPFQLADLQGIDALHMPQISEDPVVSEMLRQGWVGHSVGLGYYRYGATTRPEGANRGLADLIARARTQSGLPQRKFQDAGIRARMVMAMINEAAAIVDAEVVMRPSDIDVIAVQGFGYPRHRGGILLEADRMGLFNIVRQIDEFAKEDPQFWSAHPLLRHMARGREKFVNFEKI